MLNETETKKSASAKNTLGATLRFAFIKSLPVMAGYIVLGMGFGVLLEEQGYGVFWALAMSVFIYAGSMQYVAIDLISGGATLIATALMTLMVNARHLFYGISMINRYKGTGKFKPYLIFGLTDETYSIVCSTDAPEGVDQNRFFFFLTLMDQSYWIIGSVIGSLLGKIIPFNTDGVEFSMTALFVVIFVDQWRKTKNHLSAIIGVVVTVICRLIFGVDNFLIPSMIAITVLLSALVKVLGRKEGAKNAN